MPQEYRSSRTPRRRVGPALLLLGAFGALLSAPAGASTNEAARADAPALVAPDAISVPMERGLRLEYEGYFGGLHIGSARAVLERRGGAYRVSAEARARGLLEWFSQWRGRAESRGRLVDAPGARAGVEPKPDLHRNRGEWRGDPRWSILTYDADGRVSAQDGSPPDPNELTPIPDGSTRDTIDPISAIVAMAEAMQDGGLCEATLQLFDGRRRFDLTVTDGGVRDFAPNDYSIFQGEARGCALEIERIGGFRIERSKYAETARDRTVWVGRPIPGGPAVPVRLEVETAYGTAVVHLVGAYSADQRIALEPGRDVMADDD